MKMTNVLCVCMSGIYSRSATFIFFFPTTPFETHFFHLGRFLMTVTVSPFDRIRTNLMNQPTTGDKLYNGFVDCTVKTIQKDGVSSLWRGFIPMYVLLARYR